METKVAAVGHAIAQAVRPRSIVAPLQIGLAIQAHHVFRSRFLVDVLHAMGFASSYREVVRFEKNAADYDPSDAFKDLTEEASVLFAGDNVDHNAMTLNGTG